MKRKKILQSIAGGRNLETEGWSHSDPSSSAVIGQRADCSHRLLIDKLDDLPALRHSVSSAAAGAQILCPGLTGSPCRRSTRVFRGGVLRRPIGRRARPAQALVRVDSTEVGLGLVPLLRGAFRVDPADLLEGAGERVQVSGVLVASLPQAQDDRRRTLLLRKVAQVSGEEHTRSRSSSDVDFQLSFQRVRWALMCRTAVRTGLRVQVRKTRRTQYDLKLPAGYSGPCPAW